MGRGWRILGLALILTLSLVPAAESAKRVELGIGGYSIASSGFAIATAMAKLITKHVPGVSATGEPTGSGPANSTLLQERHLEISQVSYGMLRMHMRNKTLRFVPKQLMSVSSTFANVVVRAESNIRTIKDLKGKKVLAHYIGSPSLNIVHEGIFRANGMSMDDIVVLKYRGGSHAARQFQEGVGDAVMFPATPPAPNATEMASATKVRWLSLDEATVAEVNKKLFWWNRAVIPANTYPGQTEPVVGLALSQVLVVLPELDADLVFNIMKAVFDHEEEFHAMHPVAKRWSLKGAFKDKTVPYHEGAIKYYKSKGLWNAERDAEQQAMLEKSAKWPIFK